MSDTTQEWSRALSELTSVGNLQSLTMRPWRDVIAERSRRTESSQWCPQCLLEDRAEGATPYFRLSWDIGTVTACSKHKCRLQHVCSECGRADIRHNCAYVVPGWCTSCGAFLGAEDTEAATPAEVWIASQVNSMLARQGNTPWMASRETLLGSIRELVKRLDDGKSAVFARRLGLSKTTVHHWLKNGGTPTLPMLLRIVSQTGLALPDLITGNLSGWSPTSAKVYEMEELFPQRQKHPLSQVHDWDEIRASLNEVCTSPAPVSVTQAARNLNVNRRQLYQKASKEALNLAARCRQEEVTRSKENRRMARDFIEKAYREIVEQGKAVNLREIVAHVPREHINRCVNLLQLLREIRERDYPA